MPPHLVSGQRNEELFPEPSPEKKNDSQTPPSSPSHSHRLNISTQSGSDPPHNASAIEATPPPAPDVSDLIKRQIETALSWSYGLIAISFTLLVKSPNPPADHPGRSILCPATAVLEYLCLFVAVGIFYYSSTVQPSAELAKELKKVQCVSMSILVLDFLCRLALQFDLLPSLAITVAAAVLAPLVLFPLHRAHISTPAALRTMKISILK